MESSKFNYGSTDFLLKLTLYNGKFFVEKPKKNIT